MPGTGAGLQLRDRKFHALTAPHDTITKSRRLKKPWNISREIRVVPGSDKAVTAHLPYTNDRTDTEAIWPVDGRKLSDRNEFAVSKAGG